MWEWDGRDEKKRKRKTKEADNVRSKGHQQQHYSCYSVIRDPADERRDL
jgi:hypothetical protein